jgi:hypothetical protein
MAHPCRADVKGRQCEEYEIWDQDAACAAYIESRKKPAKPKTARIEKHAGNEEAREDEEEVNPHPRQLDMHGVIQHDREDRECTYPVKLADSPQGDISGFRKARTGVG